MRPDPYPFERGLDLVVRPGHAVADVGAALVAVAGIVEIGGPRIGPRVGPRIGKGGARAA